MKKITVLRTLGTCVFVFDLILQLTYISYFDSEIWFSIYSMISRNELYNHSLLFFMAQTAFGDFPLLGLMGFLVIVILYIVAIVALIWNKKHLFYLPVLITAINIICSILLGETPLFSFIGLIYKLFICVVHIMLIVCSQKEKLN
ncbi:MAG: hypothetical protein IJ315_09225 [Firmicutes bacterium]|nr:hypothetical protein [Bacillota bacterium]